MKDCKFRKCPSLHWAWIKVFQKVKEKWLISISSSLWCLRCFLQNGSCTFLLFLMWNNILNMIFQHLECFRKQNTEPFLIDFSLVLWILKFYEFFYCCTMQKSYVSTVSALVMRTHTWMGSWPLTFASNLFERAVRVPTGRFCN